MANAGLELYYWKDQQHREVDFVIKKALKIKQIIQVCWNLEEPRTKDREIKALMKAMEEFELKQGLIITEDYEAEEEIKGKRIKFFPLWKWLLGEN